MSRASLVAAAFAVAGGEPTDAHSFLHVDREPSRSGRRLLVAVEPMDPSPQGLELAALALATINDVFAAAASVPVPTALLRAFATANRTLFAENRSPAAGRWERRVLVGATAIAVAGREATIAQVPPAQALVVQDRQRYAFPDLASWRPDYLPETNDPEPDPLGLREGGRPLLYRTLLAPGDVILLCSANIGRALSGTPAAGLEIAADLDATLDRLGLLVAERSLDDAFAAAIRVDLPQCTLRIGSRPLRSTSRRPSAAPPTTPTPPRDTSSPLRPNPVARPAARGGAVARATGVARRETGIARAPEIRDRAGTPAGGLGAPPAASWGGASAVALAPLAFNPFGAARSALVGFVDLVRPSRPQARRSVVPGADSVHRYRGQRTMPPGLWAGLPRGVTGSPRSRLVLGVLAGSLALGGASLVVESRRHETSRVAAALAAFDAAVTSAAADPLAAASRIIEADQALAAVGDGELVPTTLGERGAALESTRDEAWAIERLGGPVRVGLLPATLRAADASLVVLGDRVYLAGVGFYEIDLPMGRLVEVLAPGQPVDGKAIGSIVDGVSDGVSVALSDGAAIYRQEADGRWGASSLAEDQVGEGLLPGRAASFNGHLYALAGEGRVVRYDDDGAGLAPTVWADASEYPDLAAARDIAVDGRVHLLLADGRVLTLDQGVLQVADIVPVTPPFSGAGFLGEAPASKALYLVEPGFRAGPVEGRVVRFDAGGATQQFVAPPPLLDDPRSSAGAAAVALGRARAVAVLEGSRTLVFLSGDELWRATLPPLIGR